MSPGWADYNFKELPSLDEEYVQCLYAAKQLQSCLDILFRKAMSHRRDKAMEIGELRTQFESYRERLQKFSKLP